MADTLTPLQRLLSDLPVILLDPASNMKVAFLVYGIIALILLILLVVGIAILMRSPEERPSAPSKPVAEFEKLAAGETFEGVGADEAGHVGGARSERPSPKVKAKPQPMSVPGRLATTAAIVLLVVAVWVIGGYTTSRSAVCTDCHGAESEHAKAQAGTDPHGDVSCVSCHESGGTLGRLVTAVPARLLHFAQSQSAASQQGEYGHVTAAACSSCHLTALVGVTTNVTRGLKISHKEPLDAAATCTDCHRLNAGVVGAHNVGMAPCLRCHDAKQASAECVTCHDEKAALAARARTVSFQDVQIPELSCDGCHNLAKECDWCHGGVRLPHSLEFKMYAHARSGAVDFWYNGGKTCGRCHTPSTRPCHKCHETLLGHAHGTGKTWLASGHQKATAKSCDTCHREFAYTATRDFCKNLCHTPVAIANSPR